MDVKVQDLLTSITMAFETKKSSNKCLWINTKYDKLDTYSRNHEQVILDVYELLFLISTKQSSLSYRA